MFGFRGSGTGTNYLDGVSVIDTLTPSNELLRNPSFENSTTTATGWSVWCQNSCTGGSDEGSISNTNCRGTAGLLCYRDSCQSGIDFLGQTLSVTIGRTYTISFWLQQTGSGFSRFYLDIFG